MTRKPGGENNSFKHGTFAENFVTLPDEEHDEFELLHQDLIEEWKPTGAIEEDAVFAVAQCIWLKRRVDRFYYWEAMRANDHPQEDVLNRVDALENMIDETAKLEDVMQVINQLPEVYKNWIERKIPRSEFKDEKSWIQGVKSEMHSLVVAHEKIVIVETQDLRFKAEKAVKLRELTAKKSL